MTTRRSSRTRSRCWTTRSPDFLHRRGEVWHIECDDVSQAGAMAPIWLITGAQAAGKSTVADLLARRYEHGVHVQGGQFYRWAVTGWVHAGDPDEAEARRLLDLRYHLSSTVADQ